MKSRLTQHRRRKSTPANDGTHADYRRPGRSRKPRAQPHARSPDKYIQKSKPTPIAKPQQGYGAYWTTLIVGASLLGSGAAKLFLQPQGSLDLIGAFAWPVATIVGAMMVLGTIYYLLKRWRRRS